MKGLALLVFVAACGGGSTSTIDAPKPADAKPSSVKVLATCPATPDSTVTVNAGGTAFVVSNATIPVNGVVHFSLGPTAFHDAASGTGGVADGTFKVGFGGDECLQFTAAGTFPFFCEAHLFAATITVQ